VAAGDDIESNRRGGKVYHRKPLPPAPSTAAAASVSTAALLGDVQNIALSSNILNIFAATFWLIAVYPSAAYATPPLPAPTIAHSPTSSSLS
jgi:hypothetical protein